MIGGAGSLGAVHILIATDAQWVVDEVTAALGGPDTRFTVVREGRAVVPVVEKDAPDLAILDLQIGTMGGIAITMRLRNSESVGEISKPIPVLLLLDRAPDTFLARRSGADGWLVKPLDAFRLQKACTAVDAEEVAANAG